MTHVYIVSHGWDDEGADIAGVFSTSKAAKDSFKTSNWKSNSRGFWRCEPTNDENEANNTYVDFVIIEKWKVK